MLDAGFSILDASAFAEATADKRCLILDAPHCDAQRAVATSTRFTSNEQGNSVLSTESIPSTHSTTSGQALSPVESTIEGFDILYSLFDKNQSQEKCLYVKRVRQYFSTEK